MRSLTICAGLVAVTVRLHAQANPYTESLLRDARALAHAVPGELPTGVGYLSAQNDSAPGSDAVEALAKTRISSVTPVFQVRYRHGWIMVDAGMDHEAAGKNGPFDDARYARIQAAVRGAGLIVATHEHLDHVGTVTKSSIADEVAPRTLLTRQQIETLLLKPKVAFTSIDSAHARHFLVVDYDRLLPIAPGMVLIRAPGHTPGNQMVYIRTASGRELIMAGDIAWLKAGVDQQRQKPDSVSRQLSEDRTAIGQQLAWLKNVAEPAGVTVVISHDGGQLQSLAKRGILSDGLDLQQN